MDLQSFADQYVVSILNGVARGVLLFTLAAGLSLLFGLMNVLNLAHGALLLVGGYFAVSLTDAGGDGFFIAMLVAVVVGGALGGALSLAVRPLEGRSHLDYALLTLGVAFILGDLTGFIWGNDFHSPSAPSALNRSVEILGSPYPMYRVAVIVVGLLLALVIYVVFERTRLGAIVRATVSDREMAAAMGVNVNVVAISVFVVAAAIASFGGVIGGPVIGVRPGLDLEVLVLALIVVVIGGLGSLRGAFIGALLIGQVQSLGVVLFPQVASFLLFGTMVLVLFFRPEGLLGTKAAS